MTLFQAMAENDREILSIQTSKKILQSYFAAMAAKESMSQHPRYTDVRVEVVDTTTTDGGLGLLTILAGEARAAALGMDRIVDLLAHAARRSFMALYIANLDNMVKGGRASFLRAFLANMLNLRPLITFEEGELKPALKIKTSDDKGEAIRDFLSSKVGGQRARLWLGISHGSDPVEARKVLAELKRYFTVEYVYFVPFGPSVYLHVGRGAVGVFALEVGSLPWLPSTPPPAFSV